MTAIGRERELVIDTRKTLLLHPRNQLKLRNKIVSVHIYTRSEGHHTYSVSVLAPDRAFYLSSMSNNLVKLRTPRMGYGSRGKRTLLRGREDETREKEKDERGARRKDQQPAVRSSPWYSLLRQNQ